MTASRRARLSGVCFSALVATGAVGAAHAQSFTEFRLPTAASSPSSITAGPDGNLWFTESSRNRIGRITTAGTITEFAIPTANSQPSGIAAGPDRNLWFTERASNKIGRITTAGTVTEFSVSGPLSGNLSDIAAGPDGNLWFVETLANKIGRVTTAGVLTEFSIPTDSGFPAGIAAGPDGNLWFTEKAANRIGRITPTGAVTEFLSPTAGSSPNRIVAGPEGNLWFTEQTGNRIGRITPAGFVSDFPVTTAGSEPFAITPGPDGNLWFTEQIGNKIGRMTPAGVMTEFPIPTGGSLPTGIAAAADGHIWFTEQIGNTIGRITTGLCAPTSTALCLNNTRFRAEVSWRVPSQGAIGVGTAVRVSGDTGYFWFFTNNNVELVIKVLDGRAVTGKFWVFYGALSDVEYTITVTDTLTGAIKRYFNPSGQLASVADTAAFPDVSSALESSGSAFATPGTDHPASDQVNPSASHDSWASLPAMSAGPVAPCVSGAAALCLNSSRFKVEVNWTVPSQGTSGVGTAVGLTSDTGYFWFFSSNNIELMIKVVDGRAFNNKFWVFYGALSNVEYTITVTDTTTGSVKTYTNPDGTLASVADTSAF